MKRIRTIILDDEKDAVENLQTIIADFCPQLKIVFSSTKPKETAKWLKQNEDPELVFLDVEMPGISGFDLLEFTNLQETKIVFVTAHDKHALKAIDFQPLAYLLKPLDIEKLLEVYQKVIALESPELDIALPQKLKIPTAKGLRFVEIDDILFVKADRSYSHINLFSGETLMVSKSMSWVLDNAQSTQLFKCHKSYAVNIERIREIQWKDGGVILMENKKEVPLTRAKKEDLMRRMQ